MNRTLENRRLSAEYIVNQHENMDTYLDEEVPRSRHPVKATAASSSAKSTHNRRKQYREKIVGKIGYEWKNIYRRLTRIDTKNSGKVNLR